MIRGIFLLHLFCNMIDELIVDHSDIVPSLLQFVFVILSQIPNNNHDFLL